MKEITVDMTPTWESAMRIFVTSLTEGNPDEESVVKTSREIIRGGRLLDQLIEERREQAERCTACVLRHDCEHQVKV